jgi:hypothetical protein
MTMAVKFKVGFTMSAETLFGIIAKFLPIEDLSVEELDLPEKLPKIGKIALAPPKVERLVAPPRPQRAVRVAGYPINVDEGVNGIIMRTLADGKPHRFKDLGAAIAAYGYASTGVGGKLNRLLQHGFIVKLGGGLWKLAEAKKTA